MTTPGTTSANKRTKRSIEVIDLTCPASSRKQHSIASNKSPRRLHSLLPAPATNSKGYRVLKPCHTCPKTPANVRTRQHKPVLSKVLQRELPSQPDQPRRPRQTNQYHHTPPPETEASAPPTTALTSGTTKGQKDATSSTASRIAKKRSPATTDHRTAPNNCHLADALKFYRETGTLPHHIFRKRDRNFRKIFNALSS
jgi:hypothetical protein